MALTTEQQKAAQKRRDAGIGYIKSGGKHVYTYGKEAYSTLTEAYAAKDKAEGKVTPATDIPSAAFQSEYEKARQAEAAAQLESNKKRREREREGRARPYDEEEKQKRVTVTPGEPMAEPKEDVIRLGGKGDDVIDLRTQRENPLNTLLDRKIASSPVLQALTSPITTAALASALVVAGGAIALGGGIVGGAVSTKATGTLMVAANAKNTVLVSGIMAKAGVSSKAIALFGGWAGAVFLGKWGQAESGEPLAIIMRDVLKQAEKTGDWSLYDEAKAARDEIINLELWEKIALWSPLAPLIGITNKIKGVLAGAKVMDKLAADKQNFSGESDDDKWERIRQEKVDSEKGLIEFYNDERKKMVEWEREARQDQRDDDASFWRKERAAQDKKEEESTKRNGEFWVEYRKEAIKMEEEAAERSADFWIDYQRRKKDIQEGGAGEPTEPGTPYTPTGTTRTYQPGSQLQFGLLKSKGEYKTEEEKKKK